MDLFGSFLYRSGTLMDLFCSFLYRSGKLEFEVLECVNVEDWRYEVFEVRRVASCARAVWRVRVVCYLCLKSAQCVFPRALGWENVISGQKDSRETRTGGSGWRSSSL